MTQRGEHLEELHFLTTKKWPYSVARTTVQKGMGATRKQPTCVYVSTFFFCPSVKSMWELSVDDTLKSPAGRWDFLIEITWCMNVRKPVNTLHSCRFSLKQPISQSCSEGLCRKNIILNPHWLKSSCYCCLTQDGCGFEPWGLFAWKELVRVSSQSVLPLHLSQFPHTLVFLQQPHPSFSHLFFSLPEDSCED